MKYLSLIVVVLLLAGCGASNKNPVSGTVTVDGKSASGVMTITPQDDLKSDSCRIKVVDGKFETTSKDIITPGKNKVTFSPTGGGGQGAQQQEGNSQGQDGGGRDRPYQKIVTIPGGGSENLVIEFTDAD